MTFTENHYPILYRALALGIFHVNDDVIHPSQVVFEKQKYQDRKEAQPVLSLLRRGFLFSISARTILFALAEIRMLYRMPFASARTVGFCVASTLPL
jgi:hypothetical protein